MVVVEIHGNIRADCGGDIPTHPLRGKSPTEWANIAALGIGNYKPICRGDYRPDCLIDDNVDYTGNIRPVVAGNYPADYPADAHIGDDADFYLIGSIGDGGNC